MAQVEHNRWFMIEIDGKEYRAKWKDYGYNYATARVDREETKSYRKYLLFGPKIVKKKWKNVISNTRDAAPEMAALGAFFRKNGLYTIVRWNGFFTNPPLIITNEELDFAFDVIDRGLTEVDKALGLA